MPIPPTTGNDDVRQLLGLAPTATAIQDFVKGEPTIKSEKECLYHSYKPQGLELCFVRAKTGDPELDEIHMYNGVTRDGYQPYQKPLPFGLTGTSQAKDIVALWGEPERKGGGGATRVPCWIEYQFEEGGGVQVKLHGSVWDIGEMGWTSLVLFR